MYATLAAQDNCAIQCFVGIFLSVNLFTDEHFDTNDIPDGCAAMVVLGKSEKGPLFSELKIKLPYRSRDVVFLRSQVLEHFSQAFEGLPEICSRVHNHQGLFRYLEKHYRSET